MRWIGNWGGLLEAFPTTGSIIYVPPIRRFIDMLAAIVNVEGSAADNKSRSCKSSVFLLRHDEASQRGFLPFPLWGLGLRPPRMDEDILEKSESRSFGGELQNDEQYVSQDRLGLTSPFAGQSRSIQVLSLPIAPGG